MYGSSMFVNVCSWVAEDCPQDADERRDRKTRRRHTRLSRLQVRLLADAATSLFTVKTWQHCGVFAAFYHVMVVFFIQEKWEEATFGRLASPSETLELVGDGKARTHWIWSVNNIRTFPFKMLIYFKYFDSLPVIMIELFCHCANNSEHKLS